MLFFHQKRKSEQQSRMKQPKILKATQKKQKQDYDHRHLSKTESKVDDIVLLKNNKRFDREGGKFSQKWFGPYTVVSTPDKGVATLKNALGLTLKKTCNIVQLKHYIQGEMRNQHQMI